MNTKSLSDVLEDLCLSEAPLNERLSNFSAALRVQALPYADAYDVLVARLQAGEAGANAFGNIGSFGYSTIGEIRYFGDAHERQRVHRLRD